MLCGSKSKRLTPEQRMNCIIAKYNRLIGQLKIVPIVADYTVAAGVGRIVIGTAALNAAEVTMPAPSAANAGRRIEIVNHSGAAQNVKSHDGTALTLKMSSGAAVATYAMPNAAAATTAGSRLVFVSDGELWILMQGT